MLKLSLHLAMADNKLQGSSFTMRFRVRKPSPCFLAYLHTFNVARIAPWEMPIYYRELSQCFYFGDSKAAAALQIHLVLLKSYFQILCSHVINQNLLEEPKASESSRSCPSYSDTQPRLRHSCLLSDILPALRDYENSAHQSAMCSLNNSHSIFD